MLWIQWNLSIMSKCKQTTDLTKRQETVSINILKMVYQMLQTFYILLNFTGQVKKPDVLNKNCFINKMTAEPEPKQGHIPELPGVLFPEIPRVLPEIQHEATGRPLERVAECE